MERIRTFITTASTVLFMLFLFPLVQVEASTVIQLEEGKTHYQLSPMVELLEDQEKKWDIDDVASGRLDKQFFQYNGNVPSFGYTSSTYWARITFENNSSETAWLLEIDYPPHDLIRLYIPTEDGTFHVRETGDLLPFSSRELPHRNFVYQLDIAEGDSQTFLIEFNTEGSMQLPIALMSKEEFHQKSLLEYLIMGLYYGFGLIMILYSLFLFASLRFTSYLWYAGFILMLMLVHFTLNGLSYQYIWPEMSWWNNRAILFFIAGTNFFSLLFTKSFLNTKTYTPTFNKLINWYMILQPVLIIILLISYEVALDLIMLATIGLVGIVITVAMLCWRRGYHPAKFFVFGWTVFLIGVMVSSIADMGLIPITFVTKYASQLGSAFEIILFSLALGAKIKALRLEKDAAEQQARKSQQLAVKHLKQANKLKDEFLTNTSHELRTPLHGIIGIAQSLRDSQGIDERVKQNLSLIISSGERLTHLINDLLDVSRLNHNEIALQIKPIMLRDMAEVICTVSASLTAGKPVTIQNLIPEELPTVAADENRLQQIMYNLVGNAIKYTDIGEVILSAEAGMEEIIVTIKDTGIGISKEDMDDIFDSYKRGKNLTDRSSIGTGLGLSITKQLLELHGGEIVIESTLGEGTTVSFSIPLYKEAEDFSQVPSLSPLHNVHTDVIRYEVATRDFDEVSPGKILIADDEAVNIRVLLNQLSMVGYELVVAYDGERVLELLADDRSFDLVILDVMLPKKSGFDVAKKIREQFSLTELPILMLTARSQMEDIVTAFDAGANDYLTKPSSKEELLARVKTLLSLKLVMEEVKAVNKQLHLLNQSLEEQVITRTEELEIKSEQLSRVDSARKQLMSNISHELGTPLTSVKGYVKAMLDGVIEADDRNYLMIVYQKIVFIDRLIQDLYELSRLEARQMSFKWQQYTINDLLSSLFKKYELDVKAHAIRFELHIHLQETERSDIVTIDVDRLDQVMHNLIFNAIRFTEKSGLIAVDIKKITELHPNGESAFQLTTDGPFLQISVRDNGKGMAKEAIKHIFDRFYQEEKAASGHTNTGLGLSISKEIIEYHQGYLWAESNVGVGSTFHFILPLFQSSSPGGEPIEA